MIVTYQVVYAQNLIKSESVQSLTNVSSSEVQVFFYAGVFQDSVVHLVWENYNEKEIKSVIVESSNDGSDFIRCSKTLISSLPDIHLNNYPKEIDYYNTVLMSTEHGNIRYIYNDVTRQTDFKQHPKWYRIKMVTFSGNIYFSQVVSTNDSFENLKDKNLKLSENGDNNTPSNEANDYTWLPENKGSKSVSCPSIGSPPSGYTATSQTHNLIGNCCSWVETLYQGTSPIMTNCGGNSYAWCCHNVPGANSCASGYVSDPCCVHYCSDYGECSCPPWECCTVQNVTQWVVTQSTQYPPIAVTATATPALICSGQCATLTGTGGSSYSWLPTNIPGSSLVGATAVVCPTSTTTYTVTGTNSQGCSGSATVTVTINPPTISGNLTLCPSGTTQLTATGTPSSSAPWVSSNTGVASVTNTGLVTGITAGSSTITFTDNNGCTNTATITVNPTPTVTVPSNIILCDSSVVAAATFVSNPPGGTFSWTNSNTAIGLASSGTGNIPQFTAINTGTTPITATITVTPATTCPGIPSSYTITVNPTPTVAVPVDITVCNGTSVSGSTFTSPVAGTTYTWTNSNTDIGLPSGNSGDIPTFTATNTGIDPISSVITVTPTASSCTGLPVTFNVLVNPTPTVAVPADTTACHGAIVNGSLFTSPTAGTTFSWTNQIATIGLAASGTGDVPSFTANNTSNALITSLITVTPTANGCTGIPSTYSISVNPLPVITFSPMPQLCFTSPPFILDQASPAGGVYSGIGITDSTYDPSVAGIGMHTITYDYTDPNTACSNTGTTQIVLAGYLTITVTPGNPFVCQGDSVQLTASGATTFTWQPTSGLHPTSGSPVSASPPTTTIYSVNGSNHDGCIGSTTVPVGVYNVPTLTITTFPKEGCSPLFVNFGYGPIGPVDTNTIYWNFGDLSSPDNTSTATFPSHMFFYNGKFPIYLSAQTTDGCPITCSDTVYAYVLPVADFYYNPTNANMSNPRIDFVDLSSDGTAWLWDFGDPASHNYNNSDLQNPFHFYTDSGTYMVQLIVYSDNSCSDTIEKPVQVYPEIIIYIPNAFTPNHDGRNEFFKPIISGIDQNNYEFYIYDRWGKLQFYTEDLDQGWDGRFNDKDSELGIYVYMVKYQSLTGKEYKVRGIVTLIR